jgi:hypothetical protein
MGDKNKAAAVSTLGGFSVLASIEQLEAAAGHGTK